MDTLGGFDADDSNWFRWKSGRDQILLGFIMGFWHAWNSIGHVKIPQLGSITSNQLRAIENILGNASQVVRPISANMTMTTKVFFIWGCTLIPPKLPTYSPPISLFFYLWFAAHNGNTWIFPNVKHQCGEWWSGLMFGCFLAQALYTNAYQEDPGISQLTRFFLVKFIKHQKIVKPSPTWPMAQKMFFKHTMP